MNKWTHIQDLNDSLEELNGMQDRVLDSFNSQSENQKNLLRDISKLKEEFQDLISDFEALE
mgnify:FL=1